MSAINLFSQSPADWSRTEDACHKQVDAVAAQLERCESVHPVAAALGRSTPVGFRYVGTDRIAGVDCRDALALPMYDVDGSIRNVAFVCMTPDGGIEELTIPGARINGCHLRFGKPATGLPIYIAMDVPSAYAIHEETGCAVVCSLYPDNTQDVAAVTQASHPGKSIVICAGTSNGPSRRVAAIAAATLGTPLAIPEEDGSFSSCLRKLGAESLIRSLDSATVPDAGVLDSTTPNPLIPRAQVLWPGHISGAAMVQHAVIQVMRHIVADVHIAMTIVLWALSTYVVNVARIAPILAIYSPVKRCGKSTALGLLKSLVSMPYASSNMTPATLYRLPGGLTLLVDEADTFVPGAGGLVGILNSGHTRDAAYVTRLEKGVPVAFFTFFMKAIVGIGRLPETLEDRSILIPLQRKRNDEQIEKHIPSDNDVFAPIRAAFSRWASVHMEDVRQATVAPIDLGNDRFSDNWEPIFAIATVLGGDWLAHAKHAAQKLSAHANQVASGKEELLRDIKWAFDAEGVDRFSSSQLIGKLISDGESPWGKFSRGGPITPNDLADMLHDFGIKSVSLRAAKPAGQSGPSPSLKGYYRRQFEDAFARYLPGTPDEAV
jgi:putative DNA primase/helicase